MSKPRKLFAKPVSRVVALDTSAHVGWLHRWNDGTTQLSWLKDQQCRVAYEPLEKTDNLDGPTVLPEVVGAQRKAGR